MILRPSEIYFTQDSIANRFGKATEHRRTKIGETLDDLVNGKCKISDIPKIRVMKENGKWWTADNRRLWIFRHLEKLGKCSTIEVNETYRIDSRKRTTVNGGTNIRINLEYDPGGIYYRKGHSIEIPKDPPTCTEKQDENPGTSTSVVLQRETAKQTGLNIINTENSTVKVSDKQITANSCFKKLTHGFKIDNTENSATNIASSSATEKKKTVTFPASISNKGNIETKSSHLTSYNLLEMKHLFPNYLLERQFFIVANPCNRLEAIWNESADDSKTLDSDDDTLTSSDDEMMSDEDEESSDSADSCDRIGSTEIQNEDEENNNHFNYFSESDDSSSQFDFETDDVSDDSGDDIETDDVSDDSGDDFETDDVSDDSGDESETAKNKVCIKISAQSLRTRDFELVLCDDDFDYDNDSNDKIYRRTTLLDKLYKKHDYDSDNQSVVMIDYVD